MVADAIAGDRVIGMALLKPGWEHDYEGRPPVFATGCSGVITHFERLPDGRYNIILRGVERFRIHDEDHERRYRRAIVENAPERPLSSGAQARLREQRGRLGALLSAASERRDPTRSTDMSDADMINALAQYLDLEGIEKQALLECDDLLDRATALIELLEMKRLMAPGSSGSTRTH
jgi:Lon protease-like protein